MKILHTADIHLRTCLDDRWAALEKILDVGKKQKIDVLAISGDLFDAQLDTEKLRPKIREVFSNNDFQIVLIPGNHDCTICQDMYFGSDTKILTDLEKPYEEGNVRIWGLPYQDLTNKQIIEKFAYLKTKLDKQYTNILLHHGELLDAFFSSSDFGEEGDYRYMPLKLSYFKDINVDYVLSGHFHSNYGVWTFDGGYFVYPGSPISITRRETGPRKINIFEVGKGPTEYILDTPYYNELTITLDPFDEKNPIEIVKEALAKTKPAEKLELTVNGYVNTKKLGLTEAAFGKELEKAAKGKCLLHPEFRDVEVILENDIFNRFLEKLSQKEVSETKKSRLRDLAIKAMMEAKA